MGWLIVALGTVYLLAVGHIQTSQRTAVLRAEQAGTSQLLARQMLLLAGAVNDRRYHHPMADGAADLSSLALAVTPDPRIRHVIAGNRLWVWMPAVPGLVEALRRLSGGSALVGTVTQGRLVWAGEAADTGLPLPPELRDGDVVYLN